jgi:predicted AlkP superfamily pyrophosphatase or phosphodiesterase
VADGKASGGPVHVVVQGGAALVYVVAEQDCAMIVERIKEVFARAEGVAKVVHTPQLKDHGLAEPDVDPRSPDLVLFAKLGYSFGESAAGDRPIGENPAVKGAHGHDENLLELRATFVAWGAGIKVGAQLGEIQNIDVAPTIAHLLGLSLTPVDGRVLTAALTE